MLEDLRHNRWEPFVVLKQELSSLARDFQCCLCNYIGYQCRLYERITLFFVQTQCRLRRYEHKWHTTIERRFTGRKKQSSSVHRVQFLVRRDWDIYWDICSYGMLRSFDWYFITDVSIQAIGYIFKVQANQEDCLILENGPDTFFPKRQ